MIQKGDDLISGANLNYQYYLSDNQMAVNSGNLIQALRLVHLFSVNLNLFENAIPISIIPLNGIDTYSFVVSKISRAPYHQ